MLGLSQKQMADLAGLAAHDISMAESGRDFKGWRGHRERIALVREELGDRRLRHEDSRVARQRAVWSEIADGPGKERLIQLLSAVAWELLDRNRCEEADLVLFILPEPIATKLLDDFFLPEEATQ